MTVTHIICGSLLVYSSAAPKNNRRHCREAGRNSARRRVVRQPLGQSPKGSGVFGTVALLFPCLLSSLFLTVCLFPDFVSHPVMIE